MPRTAHPSAIFATLAGAALLPLAGCSSSSSGPAGVGQASVVLVSDAAVANTVPAGLHLSLGQVPSTALGSLTIDLRRIDVHVAAAGTTDEAAAGDGAGNAGDAAGDETAEGPGSGWVTLELATAQPIDLLDLASTGGILIAAGSVPAGTLNQVRLFFDTASLELAEAVTPNGQAVVDPGTYDVRIPSAEQTGLKLNLKVEVEDGAAETVMLEVGVNASIGTLVWNANGFQMSPVFRTDR